MRRGEIWLYEPPDDKRRPMLVLARNEAIDGLADVIAVPATRTVRGLDTEVQVGPDDGMRVESVLTLDNNPLRREDSPPQTDHDSRSGQDARRLRRSRQSHRLRLTKALIRALGVAARRAIDHLATIRFA